MSGTKVTTDPESQIPVQEGAGTITSDSLAGESIAQGGAFAEKNPGVGASSQTSHGTTTNNTDISGATVLQPAADADAREAQESWGEEKQLQGGQGLSSSSGSGAGPGASASASSGGSGGGGGSGDLQAGQTYNATGGFESSSSSGSGGSSSASGGSGGSYQGTGSAQSTGSISQENQYPGSGQGAPAPSAAYVASSEDSKLKGENLTEGGFDSDDKNASYTSDIGGENDPGREALRQFETTSAPSAAGGEGPMQYGNVSGGAFDGLDETSS